LPAEPLLEVDDLVVEFQGRRRRTAVRALDQVDIQLLPQETVGLVGESGSGKSTLARAILGLVPVTSGSIRLAGREITNLGFREQRDVYRQIQVVFQDPYSSLNPTRTVGSALTEALGLRDQQGAVDAREEMRDMLERVRLPHDAGSRYPRHFSGGQRQRIAIARALMPSPAIVICDEAVSALDLSVQAQILNLLLELQRERGLSYLFISHDLEVVRHVSDRIVVLYRGQVMESGPASNVAAASAHPYTRALHDASPLADPRARRVTRTTASAHTDDALAASPPDPRNACAFALRCPFVADRCLAERPTLRPAGAGWAVACHRYPEWQTLANEPAAYADAAAVLKL
jgi:oligopeptide/dipeptide ABC transporter ATP-binding protein